MNYWKLWLGFGASISALVSPSHLAEATEIVRVQGAIVVQTLDQQGGIRHNFRAPFEVNLSENSWQMRVQYGSGFVETCG